MNLPFNVSLRQKDSREAADAGLLLWRENFIWFIPFFAIPFWTCAFFLRLLPGKLVYLSWIILWLLKPLFDRLILHIISVRFFESGAGFKRLLKGLGKTLRQGLPGDVLWRRFAPYRSATMPVRALELSGKSGKEAIKRKNLLKDGGLRFCFFLTLWGISLEIALLAGEISFFSIIQNLFPDNFLVNMGYFEITETVVFYLWCFNYMLIETIYVCMGFSIYINSRINVEGWDIQIIFDSFSEKLKDKKLIGILAVFCLFLFLVPASAPAEDEAPLNTLEEILKSPDFGGFKDTWGIKFKKPPNEIEFPDFDISPMKERLRLILSSGLRFIMVAVIAVLLFFIFLYVRKLIREKSFTEANTRMAILHGIPLKNPDELLEKSLEFHKQGSLRLAWGYCTAAVILLWSICRGIAFPPNATENECADMVRSTNNNPDEAKLFCTLINHWINFAYAQRIPADGSYEESIAFCKSLKTPQKEIAHG